MPSDRKLDEHRAIVDLCTLESVSADWEPTETIAHRAGIKHREVMHSAMRLAAAGVLDHRKVTWRSARCRERIRSEYRLPFLDNCTVTAQWSLFPVWLLPPIQAEPDPQFIRCIVGRHTDLTEDAIVISEIELNALPRGVRERFRDLKDAAFAKHPKVVEAQTRLDEHQDRHADCVEQVSTVKQRIEQLQTQQRNARVELKVVADGRKKLIAEALMAGDDLSVIANMFVSAALAGDSAMQEEATKAAIAFSLRNPSMALTAQSLHQSLRAKVKAQALIKGGVYLPAKRQDLLAEGRFANVE